MANITPSTLALFKKNYEILITSPFVTKFYEQNDTVNNSFFLLPKK